jgi:hypothetical protein
MADMAEPVATADNENEAGQPTIRDDEDRPQSHASRFASNHGPIDLTEDERIESPTDAAMPLIRRSTAGAVTVAAAPAASTAGFSQLNK